MLKKLLCVVVLCFVGCTQPRQSRGWYGPQGDFRSNMQQTGVHDVQWPLWERQEYAKQHGLPMPSR